MISTGKPSGLERADKVGEIYHVKWITVSCCDGKVSIYTHTHTHTQTHTHFMWDVLLKDVMQDDIIRTFLAALGCLDLKLFYYAGC